MIRITSAFNIDLAGYDCVYLIVRSLKLLEKKKHPILGQAIHVPELSPSWKLFKSTMEWKQSGEWTKEKFDAEYKPEFISDIRNSATAGDWLTQIVADDKSDRIIALGCYCRDENMCHRKIIGEMLRERGCDVVFDCDVNE